MTSVQSSLSVVIKKYTLDNNNNNTNQDEKDIIGPWQRRENYIKTFGWSIPSFDVLQRICSLQKETNLKIVDYAGGRGFWAYLLVLLGCDVVSYDNFYDFEQQSMRPTDSERYFRQRRQVMVDNGFGRLESAKNFFEIGSDDTIKIYPNSILFIAWGREHFAGNVVEQYIKNGCRHVIIIGEESGGCTFPADYFAENDEWDCECLSIPQFYGIHDYVTINIKK